MDKTIGMGAVHPYSYARFGGALYLVIIVLGLWGEAYVRGSLIVAGDPTATAERILASESLWRAGIAAQVVLLVCAIALTHVFYVLLRPVSQSLALLGVFFGLVSLSVESVSALALMDTLTPLRASDAAQAFASAELHRLAYHAISAHSHTFALALVFFGVECLIVGYLIRKSGYFPVLIGWLMQVAGACYLTNSFALFLAPQVAEMLFPMILLPAFIGELTFALWLLSKGVNMEVWRSIIACGQQRIHVREESP